VGLISEKDLVVGGEIAEGQFALVVRATLWGQRVAVKQLKARDDTDGVQILEELRREVTMLATLRHPCVVQCIGATDDAATPWLVLEYLERTLYEAVVDAAEVDIVRMLADVLSACAYIHSRPRPIVHRDLKPPNVLADLHGRCKLADFGTAVALTGPGDHLTECVGSALYMAPEVEHEAAYGVAADIFSFGAMAYECFYYRANGEDFYEGMNLFTGLDVFREPVTSSPQQMPERPSSCEDDAVWKCICDCLTTDPAKRPAAAAAALAMRTHLSSTGDDMWLSSGA